MLYFICMQACLNKDLITPLFRVWVQCMVNCGSGILGVAFDTLLLTKFVFMLMSLM